jgi:TonB family protein
MKRILISIFLLTVLGGSAQNTPGTRVKAGFGVTVVQKQPEYPGGPDSLTAFLNRTINYPVQSRIDRIQGRVYVGFMIDENGKMSDFRLLSGVNEEMNAEAMRVAQLLGTWKPGEVDGHPVRTHYVLPIDFLISPL